MGIFGDDMRGVFWRHPAPNAAAGGYVNQFKIITLTAGVPAQLKENQMADQENQWANVQTSQGQYASNQIGATLLQPDGLRAIHTRILKHCDELGGQTMALEAILDGLIGGGKDVAVNDAKGSFEKVPDPVTFTASQIERTISNEVRKQSEIIADIERALA
jgi:hypothetical protein